MSIILPNLQEVEFLEWYLQSQNLTVKLFSNDLTPDSTTVIGDFTEVAGGGYSAKVLNAEEWNIESGDADSPSYGEYAEQTWTFTGPTNSPSTIYGYYVIDEDGNLRWSERFPGSVTPFEPLADSTIKLTPRFEAS